MENHLESLDIDPGVARQYIDARAAFVELERSQKKAQQVQGGMVWKSVDSKEYLIRTSTKGAQKSLGRRTTETEAMFLNFTQKKQVLEERVSSLKNTVAQHEWMNRALRVGHMPKIAVSILRKLADAGLDEYFRIVGTHPFTPTKRRRG